MGVRFFRRDETYSADFVQLVVETLISLSLVLGVTSWIGTQLDLPRVVRFEGWWKLLFWPIVVFISPREVARLLDSYYAMYGPVDFWSSIAVGVFLAWMWGTKVLPKYRGGTEEGTGGSGPP